MSIQARVATVPKKHFYQPGHKEGLLINYKHMITERKLNADGKVSAVLSDFFLITPGFCMLPVLESVDRTVCTWLPACPDLISVPTFWFWCTGSSQLLHVQNLRAQTLQNSRGCGNTVYLRALRGFLQLKSCCTFHTADKGGASLCLEKLPSPQSKPPCCI